MKYSGWKTQTTQERFNIAYLNSNTKVHSVELNCNHMRNTDKLFRYGYCIRFIVNSSKRLANRNIVVLRVKSTDFSSEQTIYILHSFKRSSISQGFLNRWILELWFKKRDQKMESTLNSLCPSVLLGFFSKQLSFPQNTPSQPARCDSVLGG